MKVARVVFLHGLPQEIVDLVTSYTPGGFTTTSVDGKLPEEELIKVIKEAQFIVVYRARLSDRVLRAATEARLVQLLSAGYDRMNLKLMKELGIPCASNGGANSWAVSDHAVLLMLALYKHLVLADKSAREGRWSAPIDKLKTYEMANKMVGILGFGNIGRKVAQRVHSGLRGWGTVL